MIKLVDLTYYTHLNYDQPVQVAENHAPALAFASYLKNRLHFTFVKHATFHKYAVVNGVHYYFLKGLNRFWFVSVKTHQLITELKPDIILVQGFVFPLQVMFLRWFCGGNIKIIIQHHGELPFDGIKGRLQKLACNLANAFIFTAAGNAEKWKKRNILKPNAHIFELLEASTTFKPQDKTASKERTGMTGKTNFLWVGRLNANKDPITVLTGFEQYLQINADAKLYMIYQTDDMLNEVIAMFATSKTLANAVILVGKVPNTELPYWYSAADFYLSGSHKEGSGYALLEAMACGCIPVVTAIPSYQKIAGACKSVFFYPCGNAGALARLLGIVNNLDREKLSINTLDHFNKNLTFKNIADGLFDICTRLMTE